MNDEIKFNPASLLPTPGCPLVLILEDGTVTEGIRRDHIPDRRAGLGYRDMYGNILHNVAEWRYR